MVQGQRVKGQGHSVCNRQRRLTAKSVRICCLFNDDLHLWLPGGTSQNAIFSNKKKQKMLMIYARSTGAKSGWPSSCNAFAIARFLVVRYFTEFGSFWGQLRRTYFHCRLHNYWNKCPSSSRIGLCHTMVINFGILFQLYYLYCITSMLCNVFYDSMCSIR